MENIQRKLEKDVTRLTLPKPLKRKRRWTFLLVGNDGKTIAVRMFKTLVVFFLIVMFSAIATALSFHYLYKNTREENLWLESKIKANQRHMRFLRHRKDVLMARLLVTESKLKEYSSKTQIPEPQSVPEEVMEKKEVVETKVNAAVVNEPVTEQSRESIAGNQAEEPAIVGVENLAVSFDSYTDSIKVNFIIKKTDPNLTNISGRTLVVLKPDAVHHDNWVSMPSVKLISGRPSRKDRGRYFSISRFKHITLEATGLNPPVPFKYATIYVFSPDGEQLLEENLSIEMKGMD